MLNTLKSYGVDVATHCIWWFAHGLVFFGLALLVHEFLVSHSLLAPVLEAWFVDLVGSALAAVAAFLVSISIYFEGRPRTPPSNMSRKFSAPVMIALSVLFLVAIMHSGGLSRHYIDGLGAIALGGAMMRLTGVPLTFGPSN